MHGAFPQKFDQEQFKDFLRRSYKAGAVDTLTIVLDTMKEMVSKEEAVPAEYLLGFSYAIEIVKGSLDQAETHLNGGTNDTKYIGKVEGDENDNNSR